MGESEEERRDNQARDLAMQPFGQGLLQEASKEELFARRYDPEHAGKGQNSESRILPPRDGQRMEMQIVQSVARNRSDGQKR